MNIARSLLAELDRYRLWIIGAVVSVLAVIDGIQLIFVSDFQAFAVTGQRLLSGDGMNVFDFARIQVGPLHLFVDGVLYALAKAFVINHQIVLSVTVQVAFVIGLIFAARFLIDLVGGKRSSLAEGSLAAAAVVMTMPWTLYVTGHHGEGFIPLLWLFAAIEASRDRQGRAGLMIAASALLKAWGILGLPLLLFGLKSERWWRGLVVALGATALVYSPFFIFGTVQTFGHEWLTTSTDSLVSFFVEEGEPFTWGMRVLQAVATLAVGVVGVMVAKKKGSIHGLWAVPLAMTGMRLLLDPIADWYHWIPAETFVLVGLALLFSLARNKRSILVAAACYPLFLTLPSGFNGVWALGIGGLITWAGGSAMFREEKPETKPDPVLPPITTPV